MTTQHNLTDEQLCLLADWQDLTPSDRKAIRQILQHLLQTSLDLRVRQEWINQRKLEDEKMAQAA